MHAEFEVTTKLIAALQVLVIDVHIRDYLENNDPNALKQAEDAIDEAMNGPKFQPANHPGHAGS